jgi:hypothetical protein
MFRGCTGQAAAIGGRNNHDFVFVSYANHCQVSATIHTQTIIVFIRRLPTPDHCPWRQEVLAPHVLIHLRGRANVGRLENGISVDYSKLLLRAGAASFRRGGAHGLRTGGIIGKQRFRGRCFSVSSRAHGQGRKCIFIFMEQSGLLVMCSEIFRG